MRFYLNDRIDTLYFPYTHPLRHSDDFDKLIWGFLDVGMRQRLKHIAVDEIGPIYDHDFFNASSNGAMVSQAPRMREVQTLPLRAFQLFGNLEDIAIVAFHPKILRTEEGRCNSNPHVGRFQITELRNQEDGDEIAQRVLGRFAKELEYIFDGYLDKYRSPPMPPIKVMRPVDVRITRRRSKTV